MHSPPLDVLIPARNRRQAMDWSLVLASQGIAHIVDSADDTGWTLAVSAADHPAALDHIRLYRLENRHWRWQRPVFQPGMFFDGRAAAWVALIVFFHVWIQTRPDVRSSALMTGAVFSQGEAWRLFTATWMHADLSHLVTNAVFGFLFLGLAMGRYGPGVGLLAAGLAGVGGNLAGGWVHGPALHGLGASGVVMGALGLLAFPSLILPRRRATYFRKLVGGGLVAGMFIFVMIGVDPSTDVVAHLGGFVTGWMFGWMLAPAARFTRRRWVDLAAIALYISLVLLPWGLALHHL